MKPRPGYSRAAPIIPAMIAAAAAIFAAGCGGSAGTHSSATVPSVPAKFRRQVELALEYSSCMRAHGVPNFADPKISVSDTELVMQNPQMSATEVASPAYESASATCAKYLPQQQPAAPVTSTGSSLTQAVRFADCMRTHGVPNFPDPTAGGSFKLGPAINAQAPAFTGAMSDCHSLRPSTLQLSSGPAAVTST
jgi:hypothetical protein